MIESQTIERRSLEAAIAEERPRLVRFCAKLTGNYGAAEDLAQETLYEAWRNLHKLEEPAGFGKWLSAIARNVCLRWARQAGQEGIRCWSPNGRTTVESLLESYQDDTAELDLELERDELAELLDRALSLLPDETRRLLIERYIEESSRSAIAGRLGVSEGTVAMRIHRGRLALRRVLTREMGGEAAQFGFADSSHSVWEDTPIWCPGCGKFRLQGRFADNRTGLFLRCPRCCQNPQFEMFELQPTNLFTGAKTFRPALLHMAAWGDHYYRSGLANGEVPCHLCGRKHDLQRTIHPSVAASTGEHYGVHFDCAATARWGSVSLSILVLFSSEGRRFWREQQKIHTLPEREIQVEEQPALLTTLQSLSSPARLDVISARDSYDVIAVHHSV
jgi:RNA polymerase sigma factor (sigma-70 family)